MPSTQPPAQAESASAAGRIRAVAGLASVHGGGILLSLATSVLMAVRFGTGPAADAFFFVRRLTLGSTEALGQVVQVVAMPGLVATLRRGASVRREWLPPMLRLIGWLLLAAVAVAAVAPQAVALLAPGFDPQRAALSSRLLRILVFLIPASALLAVATCVLNARKRYGVPALIAQLPRWLMLAALVAAVPALSILTLGWTLLAGMVLALVILLALGRGALRDPEASRPTTSQPAAAGESGAPGLGSRWLPLLLFHAYGQVTIWIDLMFASTAAAGSVSMLEYGSRLMNLLPAILGNSLLTVMYVELSHAAAGAGRQAATRRLVRYLLAGLFCMLPLVCCLWICSDALIRLLLLRGAFEAEAAAQTAAVMRCLAPAVIFTFVLKSSISKLFVDRGVPRLKILAILIAAGLIARPLLNAVLVARLGVRGVALSASLCAALLVVCLYPLVVPHWGRFLRRAELSAAGRILLAAAAATAAMRGVLPWLESHAGTAALAPAWVILGVAASGALAYLAAAAVLRIEAWREIETLIRRRRRSSPSGAGRDSGNGA